MECQFCGCKGDFHFDECPRDQSTPAYKVWFLGFLGAKTGSLGLDEGTGDRDTYRLGWVQGDMAR